MMKNIGLKVALAATLLSFNSFAQKDSSASLLDLSGTEIGNKMDWISERKTAYNFSVGVAMMNLNAKESTSGSDKVIENFKESYSMGYSAQFAFQYPVTNSTYFKGALGYQHFLGDKISKGTKDSAGQKVYTESSHSNFGIVSFSAIYGAKFLQKGRVSPFAELGLTYFGITNPIKSRWLHEDATHVTATNREYIRGGGLGLQAALGVDVKLNSNFAIQLQGLFLTELTDGGNLNTFSIKGFEGTSLATPPQTNNRTYSNLSFGNAMAQIGLVYRP